MTDRQRELLQMIDDAFRGVELGDGVSLHESKVIDDYGSQEERLAARSLDEQVDWHRAMLDKDLSWIFATGQCGLCALDAEGWRFYLPACLSIWIREPEDELYCGMFESLHFELTKPRKTLFNGFEFLSPDQRRSIRDSLEFIHGNYLPNDMELKRAIEGYWSCFLTAEPETIEST